VTRSQTVKVVLLCVAAGAAIAGLTLYRESAEEARLAQLQAEKQAALNRQIQEAMGLLRVSEFERARSLFMAVVAADSGYRGAPLSDLIAACDKEIPNQHRLTEASALVEKRELGAARRALDQVTADTVQLRQRDEVWATIDKAIAERISDARLLASYPYDVSRMRELQALTDDLLMARPEHREGLTLRAVAVESLARQLAQTSGGPQTPAGGVRRLFFSGDVQGALGRALECAKKNAECRALVKQLAEFQQRFSRAGDLSPTAQAELVALDQKITGGEASPFTRAHLRELADGLMVKASAQKASGNWVEGVALARKAQQLEPLHPGAKAFLAEAREAARDRYLEIYRTIHHGDSLDEAIRLFQEVMEMTPPDDEFHQKAKKKLEELAK
jgi:tetratricopeptide (TPR) repeat protein